MHTLIRRSFALCFLQGEEFPWNKENKWSKLGVVFSVYYMASALPANDVKLQATRDGSSTRGGSQCCYNLQVVTVSLRHHRFPFILLLLSTIWFALDR